MSINIDAIRKKVDQLRGKKVSFSNAKLWKPSEGEHRIRVLPWPHLSLDEGEVFVERKVYFNFGKAIVSPKSLGKHDPIDDFIRNLYDEARNEGKEESKLLANKIRPSLITYALVVDRNNEAEGPHLWVLKNLVASDLLALFVDEDVMDYTDLKKGRDIKVSVTPSGRKYNGRDVLDYKVSPAMKVTPASEDPNLVKTWMANLPNIDDHYAPMEVDEIKSYFEKWLDEGGPKKILQAAKNEKNAKEFENASSSMKDEKEGAPPKKASPPQKEQENEKVEKVSKVDDDIDDAIKDLDDLLNDD